MKEVPSLETLLDREKGLNKKLSTRQMIMIAMGSAIGTGLFLGSGFAIELAGPAVLVSYLLGALIAFLLIGALAEMTIAHPTTGSFGVYAEHYLGRLMGFLLRYSYWLSLMWSIGTEVSAIAVFMKYWFADVPAWYWIVGCALLLMSVNLASVNIYGKVEYWLSFMKVVSIVIFLILGSYLIFFSSQSTQFAHSSFWSLKEFFPHGFWGAWVGVIVAIFSYMGLESIAITSGEAVEPETAVRKAFLSTIVRLIVFYLFTLIIILAIVPWQQASVSESPFVLVMNATHIPYSAGILNFIILIAALSAMNTQLYSATRMLFSLSRSGLAPKGLGKLGRTAIPWRALCISSLGIFIALGLSIFTNRPEKAFTFMMAITMFCALFTWLLIFITHIFFRKKYQGAPLKFKIPFYPLTSVLGALLLIVILLTTAWTQAFRWTLVYGIIFLLILVFVYRVFLYQKNTQ